MKKPSFEDDPPKNRHDFANSEKTKKYQNSKNQKIPKIHKIGNHQNTKKFKKMEKPDRNRRLPFRRSPPMTLKTDTILQTVKRTSKCQVSKGYGPKNRHDFVNSEQT